MGGQRRRLPPHIILTAPNHYGLSSFAELWSQAFLYTLFHYNYIIIILEEELGGMAKSPRPQLYSLDEMIYLLA